MRRGLGIGLLLTATAAIAAAIVMRDVRERERLAAYGLITANPRWVRMYEDGNSRDVYEVSEASRSLTSVAYDPQGDVLAVAHAPTELGTGTAAIDFVLRKSGELQGSAPLKELWVSDMAFSPTGREVAYSGLQIPDLSANSTVSVLNLATRAARTVFEGHVYALTWDGWSADLLVAFWTEEGSLRRPSVARVKVGALDGRAPTVVTGLISAAASDLRPGWLACLDVNGEAFWLDQRTGERRQIPLSKWVRNPSYGPVIRFVPGTDTLSLRRTGKSRDSLYLAWPPYKRPVLVSRDVGLQGFAVYRRRPSL